MAFNAIAKPILIRDTIKIMIIKTMIARRRMCIVENTCLII